MNINAVNQLFLTGGMFSAIMGLIWMIILMTRKGEQPPPDSPHAQGQKVFLAINWVIFILPFVVCLLVFAILPKSTGYRGALLSGLLGFMIPLLVSSMESQVLKKEKKAEGENLPVFLALPLSAMGITLLFMGLVINFYGLRADNLWISFIAGMGLGLFSLRLTSNLVLLPKFEALATKTESICYLIIAVVMSLLMAGHHFTRNSTQAYLPAFLLMSVFVISIVVTAPFKIGKGKNIMDILPTQLALFIFLFLGVTLFLLNRLTIRTEYNYPIITGVITSVIFILLVQPSARWIKGADLATGALVCLLLIGGIWFSYASAMGFGLTLYSVSLLSLVPLLIAHKGFETYRPPREDEGVFSHPNPIHPPDTDEISAGTDNPKVTAIMDEKPAPLPEKSEPDDRITWGRIFLKGITFAGLTTILLGLFLVLKQRSHLLDYGLDISVMETLLGFMLGIFISLFFEGFNITGSNIFTREKPGTPIMGMGLFFSACLIILTLVLSVGIFFKLEGLGALVLGLFIPAMLGTFSYFSQRHNRGLFRASLAPLWITASVIPCFISHLHELPYEISKLHKQEILAGIIGLIIIVYLISHFARRKKETS